MSAGPDVWRAMAPVVTKMPEPMTAPTPRLVSCTGPSTRRSRLSPAASASSVEIDLRTKSERATAPPPLAGRLAARRLFRERLGEPGEAIYAATLRGLRASAGGAGR